MSSSAHAAALAAPADGRLGRPGDLAARARGGAPERARGGGVGRPRAGPPRAAFVVSSKCDCINASFLASEQY